MGRVTVVESLWCNENSSLYILKCHHPFNIFVPIFISQVLGTIYKFSSSLLPFTHHLRLSRQNQKPCSTSLVELLYIRTCINLHCPTSLAKLGGGNLAICHWEVGRSISNTNVVWARMSPLYCAKFKDTFMHTFSFFGPSVRVKDGVVRFVKSMWVAIIIGWEVDILFGGPKKLKALQGTIPSFKIFAFSWIKVFTSTTPF